MFTWYHKASVCYTYLYDIPGRDDTGRFFGQSSWFTRGWTLQELISPQKMEFYAADWSYVGSRGSLCSEISRICDIEPKYLTGDPDLKSASIAKRMSWAAKRRTTRVEDSAYCLLGIFDINMPMIYGEGKKAFRRLQEEIIRLYPEDHSLYAWGTLPIASNESSIPSLLTTQIEKRIAHGPVEELLSGLLAESPKDFANSGDIVPVPWVSRFYRMRRKGKPTAAPAIAVGKGMKIDLPVIPREVHSTFGGNLSPNSRYRLGVWAVLLCTAPRNKNILLVLPLVSWGDGYFGRTKELAFASHIQMEREDPSTLMNLHQPLHVAPETRIQLEPFDVIIRELKVVQRKKLCLWGWHTNVNFDFLQERIIRPRDRMIGGYLAYNFTYGSSGTQGFSIFLGRKKHDNYSQPEVWMRVLRWNPPFDCLPWETAMDGSCVLETNSDFEQAKSPFRGIKIFTQVERVRTDKDTTSGDLAFIDVVDLHVVENGSKFNNSSDTGNTIHTTGTISTTFEGSANLPACSRWKKLWSTRLN